MRILKNVSLVGKICTIILSVLLTLSIVATPVLTAKDTVGIINNAMNIVTWEKMELPYDPDNPVEPIEEYKTEYDSIKSLKDDSHAISQQVQTEGAVLLMNNDNTLPLAKGSTVNLYDIASVDPFWGGFGSGQAGVIGGTGRIKYGIYDSPDFPKESKQNYYTSLTNAGLTVNKSLFDWYASPTNPGRRGSFSGWQNQPDINGTTWNELNGSGYATTPADVGIFVIGRQGGENQDHPLLSWSEAGSNASRNQVKSYLKLSTNEMDVLSHLKDLRANGTLKKLVLLINSSNQPELDWLTDGRYNFDAAMWIGGLGENGINGVADLLVGDANPSGRLPFVFWNRHADNPVMTNFGGFNWGDEGSPNNNGTMATVSIEAKDNVSNLYVAYQEGMYLGYRYTETRYEDAILNQGNAVTNGNRSGGDFDYNEIVAYPFGHGLSYTNFEYTGFNVTKNHFNSYPLSNPRYLPYSNIADRVVDADNVSPTNPEGRVQKTFYNVSVTVTNKGTTPGKESVQVYLQRPYTTYDMQNGIEKPSIELVAFAKTPILQPGASWTFGGANPDAPAIEVDEKYFAAFDTYGEGTYVATGGDYYLATGRNSHDALNNILATKNASGMVDYLGSTIAGNKALAWKIDGSGSDANTNASRHPFGTSLTALNEAGRTKYKYSDVTGNEITVLFDLADPNRFDDGVNSVQYMTRSDWAGTTSYINDAVGATESQNTNRVLLQRSQQLNERITENRTPLAKDVTDRGAPTFGETPSTGAITLAEMSLRNPDGTMYYGYDDRMWDTFLDQLTWDDYSNMLSDGKRHTLPLESVVKPKTIEFNGPVGFTVQYDDSGAMNSGAETWTQDGETLTLPAISGHSSGDGTTSEKDSGSYGLARIGVFRGEDGTLIPRRFDTNDEENNWYEAQFEKLYPNDTMERILDMNRRAYPTAYPSNPIVAATLNLELIEKMGEMIGEDALWGGASGIYGTGVNIIRTAHAGRAFEYYSECGTLSGIIGAAWTRGVQSKGCYVYNKHFVLNDQEYGRKGIATFVNEQTFREIYLRAFEIPIVDGGARAMMGAYNRVGVEFAPSVKNLYTDWLRGETGFDGFTVTDWWNSSSDDYYMTLSRTIMAGNDLPDGQLSNSQVSRHGVGGTHENTELMWAMRESMKHILFTVADSNAMNGFSTNTRIIVHDVAWPKMIIATHVTLCVLFGLSAAAYVGSSGTMLAFKLMKKTFA